MLCMHKHKHIQACQLMPDDAVALSSWPGWPFQRVSSVVESDASWNTQASYMRCFAQDRYPSPWLDACKLSRFT